MSRRNSNGEELGPAAHDGGSYDDHQLRPSAERTLRLVLAFLQNDGVAASYQTLGQYRSEVIRLIASQTGAG
jgi:hypothetical protein